MADTAYVAGCSERQRQLQCPVAVRFNCPQTDYYFVTQFVSPNTFILFDTFTVLQYFMI